MQLDSVVTVAIGRNSKDGKPLTSRRWANFQNRVKMTLSELALVVAHTQGAGVGSDGVNESEAEDSAVLVAINPKDKELLRQRLAKLLPRYGQTSAAFAIDASHEPVFPTKDGYRR
jgi:hypothetical protein